MTSRPGPCPLRHVPAPARSAAAASYAAGMRVALCQLPVSPEPAINLERVAEAMTTAAQHGADLAVFPEATQARFGSDLRAAAEPVDGAFCTGLAGLARETGVALVAGVFEPAPDGRVYNTAVAYDGSGELVAAYRKIHLFDALGERESVLVAPGSEPVVADLAGIRTGFATCYDIRFPELFRALVARGAELIVVPGAWAAGLFKEEHWVTLVRARAIENTAWVAAAGQVPDPSAPPTRAPTGVGRSMLVDPMGTVRADLGLWPQVTVAELDCALTARVRAVLPSLEHRRSDVFGPADPASAAPPASPVSGSGSATAREAAQYR
jgi:deaminated glutathione amidase